MGEGNAGAHCKRGSSLIDTILLLKCVPFHCIPVRPDTLHIPDQIKEIRAFTSKYVRVSIDSYIYMRSYGDVIELHPHRCHEV